jgi:Bacterial SH3 domain
MNKLKCSLLSTGFVVLSTGWAAAAPAVVLDYLNLRYAPGFDQYIIEVIPPGWIVNTGACADGWCQVNVNGVLGFVDSDYLGAAAPGYWPSYGYASAWTYPNYAYYYGYGGGGYGGGPYVGPYGGVYAQGRDADLKAARRQVDRAKPTAVARDNGAVTPHAAKPAKGPIPIGLATAAVRSKSKG